MRKVILALLLGLIPSFSLSAVNKSCEIERLIKALQEKPDLAKDFIGIDKEEAKIMGCRWRDATNGIELGNFELFDLLKPYTDSSFSEELSLSKELSIFHATSKALKYGHCVPSVIEPSLPDWIELLNVGLEKIRSVKDHNLIEQKKKCVTEYTSAIEKAKKEYKEVCVLRSRPNTWSAGCFKSDRFEFETGRK